MGAALKIREEVARETSSLVRCAARCWNFYRETRAVRRSGTPSSSGGGTGRESREQAPVQQPGGVAPGHEPAGGGRAALSPRPGDRRASRTAPTTPTSRPPQQPGGVAPGTNRLAEAEPLFRRALAIDEQSYGPDHPDVASDLNNLAGCSRPRTAWRRPSRSYRRALAIDEKAYGPDHPDVATDLNNLAELLQATNRLAEAEPLYRRALAIDERSYGPDHPDVASDLNNLAALLQATNRLSEAEPLFRRALAIDERRTAPTTPTSRPTSTTWRSCSRPRIASGGRAALSPRLAIDETIVRPRPPRRRDRPQQPGVVAPGHEPAGGGRAAHGTRRSHPLRDSSDRPATNIRTCVRVAKIPPTAHRAEARRARDRSADQGGEGGDGQALADRPRGGATPRPGQTGRGRADIAGSPVQGAGQAGRLFPQAEEPIAPHLDELLRPNGDGLNARESPPSAGCSCRRGRALRSRAGAHGRPTRTGPGEAQDPHESCGGVARTGTGRTGSRRTLELAAGTRPSPGPDSAMKGRARYHLALCQWRLGDRAAAQRSAEASLAAYDAAPKANPVDPAIRRQSEELLAAVKAGKAPPPPAADRRTRRTRGRPRPLSSPRGADEAPPQPEGGSLAGPGPRPGPVHRRRSSTRSTASTASKGNPRSGSCRSTNRSRRTSINSSARPRRSRTCSTRSTASTASKAKPAVWFLPLSQPISPHLDELLGKLKS